MTVTRQVIHCRVFSKIMPRFLTRLQEYEQKPAATNPEDEIENSPFLLIINQQLDLSFDEKDWKVRLHIHDNI